MKRGMQYISTTFVVLLCYSASCYLIVGIHGEEVARTRFSPGRKAIFSYHLKLLKHCANALKAEVNFAQILRSFVYLPSALLLTSFSCAPWSILTNCV